MNLLFSHLHEEPGARLRSVSVAVALVACLMVAANGLIYAYWAVRKRDVPSFVGVAVLTSAILLCSLVPCG